MIRLTSAIKRWRITTPVASECGSDHPGVGPAWRRIAFTVSRAGVVRNRVGPFLSSCIRPAIVPANKSTLDLARIIELPQRNDDRGGLGFVEASRQIPFDVKRVYYMYDIAPGAARGAHAHKALQQLVIAASGTFVVSLSDGVDTRHFELNSPASGLYVPHMLWRDLTDFSSQAFCLVLASEYYDEADYLRDYDAYLHVRGLPAR